MKRNLGNVLVLATLLLLPAAARADGDLNNRITLDVSGAKPQEVFQSIAKVLGTQVAFDPAIQQKVSIRLEQVTVRTALNAVCESLACRWALHKDKLEIAPLATTASRSSAALDSVVDIKVTNANLQDFVASVASMMNGKLSFDASLEKATITLAVDKQSLRSVLDAACAQGGCRWRVIEGNKPVLEVRAK